MKKLFYIAIVAFAAFAVSSCKKFEPEMTATVDMAGQWYVTVDGAYDDGSEDWEDPYGMGRFLIVTSNTAANVPTEMWVNDLGAFWEFSVKVNVNQENKTFSVTDGQNYSYKSSVTINDGKIVPGGYTTPSGMPADYIEFYVIFDDDDYIGDLYDSLKFSGYRYTGLADDEE